MADRNLIDRLKHADRNALALGTIVLAIVSFLAINTLVQMTLTSTRVDLTEDGLYTLSDGTRELLSSIEEPIDIRFYYSRRFDEIGPHIARYAQRVDELLREYVRLSDGKIRVSRFDPEPFSPEEDLAVSDGLQGLPFDQSGDKVYFGLAGSNSTDDVDAIPYLAAERGNFLEYDLTRLISNLSHPEKAVVALISDLPLQGTQFDNYQPWLIVDSLKQFFDVKFLDKDATELPKNAEIVVIAGAHFLREPLLYQIDQFVMKGGRVFAMIDPFSESMSLAGPAAGQLPPPGVQFGAVEPLMKAWGVEMHPSKFVGDVNSAIRVGFPNPETGQQVAVDYLAWLNLQGDDRFTRDDAVTAQVQRIVMTTAGGIFPAEGATTKFERLIRTSPVAAELSAFQIAQNPNPIAMLNSFESAGQPFTLAARVTGPVKSAYPDGPTEKMLEEAGDKAAELKAAHIGEAQKPLNLVIVGDADIITDRNWAQIQEFGGKRVAIPTASNADFAVNVIDNLRGSESLVGLRGRGLSIRPFEVIADMQREADSRFRAKEQELQAKIKETEQKIGKLQKEEQTTGVLLTAQQQAEIDDFRAEMLSLRRELRDVQHSLRQDVESLQSRIRIINIWAIPVLVAIVAIVLALVRRARRARFHRAALH
jgi:ABC-type uncharacterized transport system involved in gliding motility auxiliary subunit